MNTHRYGWNTRGGSVRDDMENAREQSEKLNPNSDYWEQLALVEIEKLQAYLGDSYDLWAEMQEPSFVWKNTYEHCHQTLATPLANVLAELECTCNGVTGPCKVCQAYARMNAEVVA